MPAQVINASGNADIDGILWGWRWDHNAITYSFPADTSSYLNNGYVQIVSFQALNAVQQDAVHAIVANIATFANLTFSEVSGFATLRYADASQVNYTNDNTVAGYTGLHQFGPFATAEANPPELAFGGNRLFRPPTRKATAGIRPEATTIPGSAASSTPPV